MSLSSAGCRSLPLARFTLASHGLQRQGSGHIPGQPDMDSGVYQSIDEEEDVGRAAGTQGSGHIQVLFVGDVISPLPWSSILTGAASRLPSLT